MTQNEEQVRISDLIIEKFWDVFNDDTHTHKILTSGRAGTKSSEAAIETVFKIVQDVDGSAVVIRKRHNKLRKPVYTEIKRDGFQMLYLYNPPKNPNAPVVTWTRKMEQRPDCVHVHVDYRDVPPEWIGRKLLESAEVLHQVDERQWRWLWLGQSIGVDELIYYMFSDRHVGRTEEDAFQIIGVGVDYGQQNATTYQAAGLNVAKRKLEGLAEYYHSGRETGSQKSPSDYAKDFVGFLDDLHERYSCGLFYTYIDPSARGLMEEIKRAVREAPYTVLIRDAENDVALGISRVQKLLTFDMLSIDPKQEHAREEFGLYEYDKKSIERGLEKPVKLSDHCMDALRYLVMGLWSKLKRFLPVQDKDDLEDLDITAPKKDAEMLRDADMEAARHERI